MQDYKLVFDNESQANEAIGQVTDDLHPSQYVLYVIGVHQKIEYNEDDPEAEPVVTLLSDKWLVDMRLRTANKLLDKYSVEVETPIHSFS
ncbi:hypothetical protein ACS8FA_07365 [Psychrobacter sp. 1Y1]|uniref:hypothetical protein n=1 Tax=Psychrobacter sp. 1Y1 TaxID=3453574 RepID=UPI003F456C8D